jgi:hypothetical protein
VFRDGETTKLTVNSTVYQVTGFPKGTAEDTVLTTSSTDGKNTPITVTIPKDTRVLVDVLGLHYNRKSITSGFPLWFLTLTSC